MITMILTQIRSFFRYRDSMRQLETLSDRELADIGLSRGELESAAWRAARA